MQLTQAEVKNEVEYDPDTGNFIRLRGKGKGNLAGSINKYKQYVYIRIAGKRYMAHRIAWLYVYGASPDGDIDHINRIKHDNRIANLRVVSKSDNQHNHPKSRSNTSGFTGVYFNKYSWVAQITYKGKVIYLGSFATKEEAINKRKVANEVFEFSATHGA